MSWVEPDVPDVALRAPGFYVTGSPQLGRVLLGPTGIPAFM